MNGGSNTRDISAWSHIIFATYDILGIRLQGGLGAAQKANYSCTYECGRTSSQWQVMSDFVPPLTLRLNRMQNSNARSISKRPMCLWPALRKGWLPMEIENLG